ncbi:hypothetical protein ACQKP0_08805 [Heyndrickxia sp. NPDC080065]|uniref:hypothetical protein n=1 Tax=Heyndrickxia sp. NPDC080065 TaxID=3390568 RepID=UPI003D039DF5
MKCQICQHENEGGRFCENCGSKLITSTKDETAATVESAHSSSDKVQYFETTKKISNQYFNYFIQVLKKPYASSQSVGSEHFINGIMTIILFSLLIPLIFYFALKGVLADFSSYGSNFFGTPVEIKPPFTDIVIKPFFAYIIFTFLVITFTFASIKLGRINVSYKEVTARFGSLLIPFVSLLAISLIMSILKIKFFFYFLLLGFIGSIFMIPPLVIASYKKDHQEGVDVIFGSLLTYVLTFISISIMANMLFEVLRSVFSSFYGGFFDL